MQRGSEDSIVPRNMMYSQLYVVCESSGLFSFISSFLLCEPRQMSMIMCSTYARAFEWSRSLNFEGCSMAPAALWRMHVACERDQPPPLDVA